MYYDTIANDYFEATKLVDMTHVYRKFLPLVPTRGRILDAGCGSGRDALAFIRFGYEVELFDASEKLAELAANYCNRGVDVATFEEMDYGNEKFDAIWASASLLHEKRENLKRVLERMRNGLKIGGHLYMSFKQGSPSSDYSKSDMTWYFMNKNSVKQYLPQGLHMETNWVDPDTARKGLYWYNVILRRTL